MDTHTEEDIVSFINNSVTNNNDASGYNEYSQDLLAPTQKFSESIVEDSQAQILTVQETQTLENTNDNLINNQSNLLMEFPKEASKPRKCVWRGCKDHSAFTFQCVMLGCEHFIHKVCYKHLCSRYAMPIFIGDFVACRKKCQNIYIKDAREREAKEADQPSWDKDGKLGVADTKNSISCLINKWTTKGKYIPW